MLIDGIAFSHHSQLFWEISSAVSKAVITVLLKKRETVYLKILMSEYIISENGLRLEKKV